MNIFGPLLETVMKIYSMTVAYSVCWQFLTRLPESSFRRFW